MRTMKPSRKKPISNTWVVLSVLTISFSLFQLNLIYSIVTNTECKILSEFWLSPGHNELAVYPTTLTIFILIGAWSCIEFLRGVFNQVIDKYFSIAVNFMAVISITYCIYAMSIQWKYFDLVQDREYYSFIFARPYIDSWGAYTAYDNFVIQKYCDGTYSHRYSESQEDEDRRIAEFSESGKIRKSKPQQIFVR